MAEANVRGTVSKIGFAPLPVIGPGYDVKTITDMGSDVEQARHSFSSSDIDQELWKPKKQYRIGSKRRRDNG